MTFLFVGEKRSHRAIAMDVTWEDGHLAARTLHNALRACGIDPQAQHYTNIFHDGAGYVFNRHALVRIEELRARGATVVALGNRVHQLLEAQDIPHIHLTHPAARGAIRLTAAYQAHVTEQLTTRSCT